LDDGSSHRLQHQETMRFLIRTLAKVPRVITRSFPRRLP
jgi:hypothetical protein